MAGCSPAAGTGSSAPASRDNATRTIAPVSSLAAVSGSRGKGEKFGHSSETAYFAAAGSASMSKARYSRSSRAAAPRSPPARRRHASRAKDGATLAASENAPVEAEWNGSRAAFPRREPRQPGIGGDFRHQPVGIGGLVHHADDGRQAGEPLHGRRGDLDIGPRRAIIDDEREIDRSRHRLAVAVDALLARLVASRASPAPLPLLPPSWRRG